MDLTVWKQAKKEKKLTIAEIAHKASLPKGTVQNIFAGYIPNPRIDTVQAIEQALGLAPTAYEESAGWQKTKKSSLTTEEDEWLDLYYKLSSHGRTCVQTVTALIENYLNALSVK